MTILMVTHDIKEGFALGTRLIVLDRWRDDAQAQERFGAVITYDLDLTRDSTVPVFRFSKPLDAAASAGQAHGSSRMMFDRSTRRSRKAGLSAAARARAHRHHPDFDKLATQGWKALEAEGRLSERGWRKEQQWALDMGLPGAESIIDKTIPTFARGELPHFAGINTFLKAPYVENVRDVGKYDAAIDRHPV